MNKKEVKVADVQLNPEKKKDIPQIDPRSIDVNPNNVRTELGDYIELGQSIADIGLQVPLKVRRSKTEKGRFILVDGHRRLAGIMNAISKGADIAYVDAQIFTGNTEDELFTMLTTGTGQKQLTEVELAEGFKRLVAHGYTATDIARKIGKSIQFVNNMLLLANTPKVVKDRVNSGEISGNTVVNIAREIKDEKKVVEVVEKAVETAKERAKTTGKATKARAKDVTGLKNKSVEQKLKELILFFDTNNIKNDKTELIAELVAKVTYESVEELAKLATE